MHTQNIPEVPNERPNTFEVHNVLSLLVRMGGHLQKKIGLYFWLKLLFLLVGVRYFLSFWIILGSKWRGNTLQAQFQHFLSHTQFHIFVALRFLSFSFFYNVSSLLRCDAKIQALIHFDLIHS